MAFGVRHPNAALALEGVRHARAEATRRPLLLDPVPFCTIAFKTAARSLRSPKAGSLHVNTFALFNRLCLTAIGNDIQTHISSQLTVYYNAASELSSQSSQSLSYGCHRLWYPRFVFNEHSRQVPLNLGTLESVGQPLFIFLVQGHRHLLRHPLAAGH